jgi:hypothetical protein
VSGIGCSIPVEILDADISSAKHIAEKILPHIKKISWAADGITLAITEDGFVKETWFIMLENEYQKVGWVRLTNCEPENNWKTIREKQCQ